MYTEVLRSIDGVGIFPAISLVVFVLFFSAMLVWVWRLSSDRLVEYSRLPLDAGAPRPGSGTRTSSSERSRS